MNVMLGDSVLSEPLCISRKHLTKIVKMGGDISVSWNEYNSPIKFENQYGMIAILMPIRK